MMAQVYCLTQEAQDQLLNLSTASDDNDEAARESSTTMEDASDDISPPLLFFSIPGKGRPHPTSPTDNSFFEPSPMDGNPQLTVFFSIQLQEQIA